ncbi:uncharacterized protein LAESUDRAFT_764821 [Laetiporus sulphureus 93-53]|uniref:Uncharacterized protein n=1 Tax=Laetiporus sulphureus 93-53 TaxID=1314785 RepID=A0A165B4N8_9APHY|nr:uncharacterized protein LAESUDRAFT_764821 [Laetiporus sulphureus 93-53]KZT00227.1 hypothetical protein LAESUDRAFT_764821 [Laetiporus sulphureus 93-53]
MVTRGDQVIVLYYVTHMPIYLYYPLLAKLFSGSEPALGKTRLGLNHPQPRTPGRRARGDPREKMNKKQLQVYSDLH